jgi:hypothetical protein
MRKAMNMLSPMHPKATTRLRAITLHMKRECLVVVWAIIHFRPYFYGTKFILYTDHRPIKWLMTNDKLFGKLARWAFLFQEYEFKVNHQPGITHQNEDTMLRKPFTTSEDFS